MLEEAQRWVVDNKGCVLVVEHDWVEGPGLLEASSGVVHRDQQDVEVLFLEEPQIEEVVHLVQTGLMVLVVGRAKSPCPEVGGLPALGASLELGAFPIQALLAAVPLIQQVEVDLSSGVEGHPFLVAQYEVAALCCLEVLVPTEAFQVVGLSQEGEFQAAQWTGSLCMLALVAQS